MAAGAIVPAMPQIIAANQAFHESPHWGLLGSLAGCATAVGPGAALALASPTGAVGSYEPSAAGLSAAVLARCPLTVIDLGQTGGIERTGASAVDGRLAAIVADLAPGTLLLVISPGAAVAPGSGGGPAGPPHLMSVVVSGPGFADGLLTATSTRRPGIVTLTDLTPTVAGWLGRAVPRGTVGAQIGRTSRGDLPATISALLDRDTAEQVWLATHGWFFVGYALADALAFGLPALLFWGAQEERRRARARCWRAAGVLAAAVPLGSYLANAFPWWQRAHPAWWLYGLAVAWTLAVAALALAGPWRRDPFGPFGLICLATLALLGLDAMTGSRLQPEAPFGLSLLVSGRYYGIGNDVLGVYCVSALVGAAWLGRAAARRPTAAMTAVGLFAVVALGWPGFGAKAGGTIALVPCLLLLLIAGRGGGQRSRRPDRPGQARLALGDADRAQRCRPDRGVRTDQLLPPGRRPVRHRDVRGQFAAGRRRRAARAQGRLECGNAHGERGPMADPGRGGDGLCRALAAVIAPAADAAAGLRGRAGAANRRLAVLAGAYSWLARR